MKRRLFLIRTNLFLASLSLIAACGPLEELLFGKKVERQPTPTAPVVKKPGAVAPY